MLTSHPGVTWRHEWYIAQPRRPSASASAKPTLYAYVSRGQLVSHPIPGAHRGSRYLATEIDRLAARSRGRSATGGFSVVVDSSLTLLDPAGKLYYRGWDVEAACREASYERVAEWLWTGVDAGEPAAWSATHAGSSPPSRRATEDLPSQTSLVDRMRIGLAVVAVTDPMRHDRRPEAVATVGRALIATLVDGLPDPATRRLVDRRPAVAQTVRRARPRRRRWPPSTPRWSCWPTTISAASTLAARVAASTWADPYLCVQAGLAALGGPLHGAASDRTRAPVRRGARRPVGRGGRRRPAPRRRRASPASGIPSTATAIRAPMRCSKRSRRPRRQPRRCRPYRRSAR